MLPRPKFDLNPRPTQVTASPAPPSAQSWFQYNPNQSLNQHFVNNYPNYDQNYSNNNFNYQSFGNTYQPSVWPQNHYNSSHNLSANNVWNGFQNQNNIRFNQNNNQNYRQQNPRNDYQNKKFKDNNHKNFKNHSNNNNNNNKTLNCDSCCRWFPTEELYNQHLSEHIVCGLDECTFRAHPKVIENHQKMQHFCFKDRTLVKKFMSLETEEEIEKWKEERRRHFPTKDNIQKKKELRELKEKQRLQELEDNKKKEMDEKQHQNKDSELKGKADNRCDQRSKRNKRSSKLKAKQNVFNASKYNRKLTLFQKLMANEIQEQNEEKTNEKVVQ